jgi:hypothetical protein
MRLCVLQAASLDCILCHQEIQWSDSSNIGPIQNPKEKKKFAKIFQILVHELLELLYIYIYIYIYIKIKLHGLSPR